VEKRFGAAVKPGAAHSPMRANQIIALVGATGCSSYYLIRFVAS
jgi:hypothetical protein